MLSTRAMTRLALRWRAARQPLIKRGRHKATAEGDDKDLLPPLVRDAIPPGFLSRLESASADASFSSSVQPAHEALTAAMEEAKELSAMASEEENGELRSAAERELKEEVAPRLRTLAEDAAEAMLSASCRGEEAFDEDDAALEVRAGAGGQEAALFAKEVFDMYCRYAEHLGYSVEVTDYQPISLTAGGKGAAKFAREGGGGGGTGGAVTGIQEAVAEVRGRGVFRALKYECGVHRVQRVPVTGSKSDRLQTSTCSVAVLPKPDEEALYIPDQDLHFQFMRSQGPGGQNVNKLDTACRVTHIPTGIAVRCEESRSQLTNKTRAVEKLRAELYRLKFEESMKTVNQSRKSQVGNMDRNEKIRTYNYSRNSVTDHRAGEAGASVAKQVQSMHQFFHGGDGGQAFHVVEAFAKQLAEKSRRDRVREVLEGSGMTRF